MIEVEATKKINNKITTHRITHNKKLIKIQKQLIHHVHNHKVMCCYKLCCYCCCCCFTYYCELKVFRIFFFCCCYCYYTAAVSFIFILFWYFYFIGHDLNKLWMRLQPKAKAKGRDYMLKDYSFIYFLNKKKTQNKVLLDIIYDFVIFFSFCLCTFDFYCNRCHIVFQCCTNIYMYPFYHKYVMMRAITEIFSFSNCEQLWIQVRSWLFFCECYQWME